MSRLRRPEDSDWQRNYINIDTSPTLDVVSWKLIHVTNDFVSSVVGSGGVLAVSAVTAGCGILR